MLADDPAGYASYRPGKPKPPPVKNPYGSLGPSPQTVWGVTPEQINPYGTLGPSPETVGLATPAFKPPVPAPQAPAPPAKPAWDMNAAIDADWETIAANAAANQMNTDAMSDFQRALRQAYIDYGGSGENLGQWAQYIDAPTIAAAQANKFSTLALNRVNAERAKAQAESAMAARGMLGSGDTVNALKKILFNREGADYSGLRTFDTSAYSGLKELGQIKQQASDKIAAARGSAAGRAGEAAPVSDAAVTAAAAATGTAAPGAKYTWDETVTNLTQLSAWLKARGRTLASFKASNPAAYAKLAAQ